MIGLIEEFKSYTRLVDYPFASMLVGCDFERNFLKDLVSVSSLFISFIKIEIKAI